MAVQVFTNISLLVNTTVQSILLKGQALKALPCIQNAYLIIEDDLIAEYGDMQTFELSRFEKSQVHDVEGKLIMPCWCDSHTHLVFAGSREDEFVDKLKGLSYAEIAANGGGILNSAEKLNRFSEDELFQLAWERLFQIGKLGTGAVEIKSGYGLSAEGELKMLRVIKRLKEKSPFIIKSTFFGAHTYPLQFKDNHEGYIKTITEEMLPVIAKENLADFVDVFCEQGFFSPQEMNIICQKAMQFGLRPKLHVNQLNSIGGIEVGIKLNALSLDHLETLTQKDIALLSNKNKSGISPDILWNGVCTLLPTAAFFLRMPLQPARQLIDNGCAIALASDYNPGSSPSGNMNFVAALSCIQMRMLPEECINAATINGAFAMGVQDIAGSITVGKKANLIFIKSIPGINYIPYSFGTNLIDSVMINGSFLT